MKRIMKEYLAEKTARADRSWLPNEKIYNSFSHAPKKTDYRQSDIFYKGRLNPYLDSKKINL